MRLPRVRSTVRRMLVAVAIVALALGGAAWWRRTTVVRESRIVVWIGGVPDVVVREYADGRVEHEPARDDSLDRGAAAAPARPGN